MLTRSRLINFASALAGDPPNEPLPGGIPEFLRYEMAADFETELTRDMNLSVQDRTVASFPIRLSPNQREFTVTQSGLENPTYVSMTRESTPELVPQPITIGNLALIDDEARNGRHAVAFYSDKPQKGIVSWMPDGSETLTIWYDRSPVTDPSADQTNFTITDSYVPLLKLLLAAQMLEMLEKPIGKMLESRIARGMGQWQKFVKNGKQQGIIEKPCGLSRGRGTNRGIWTSEFPVS